MQENNIINKFKGWDFQEFLERVSESMYHHLQKFHKSY